MRSSLVFALAFSLLPSLAEAQVYYVPSPRAAKAAIKAQRKIDKVVRKLNRWNERHGWAPTPVQVYVPAPRVYVQPAPAPMYVAPPEAPVPPPPPPPPPVMEYQAPPIYVPAPSVQVVLPPRPRLLLPQWKSRLGLGVTGEGLFATDGAHLKGWGVDGQFRFRTSRHTAIELMGGYQRSTTSQGLTRSDVPLSFGLMVPFLGPEHAVTPYFVTAAGLNFADLRMIDTPTVRLDDKRVQGLANLGFGLEARLGQHFALNADARLEGRWNLQGPSDDVRQAHVKVDGEQVEPIGKSIGVRIGLGACAYF